MVFEIKEAYIVFCNECVCVFLCMSPLLTFVYVFFPVFLGPCHFVTVCLKVWLSLFYRPGHLSWHMWSLDGERVGECEMAHVGT